MEEIELNLSQAQVNKLLKGEIIQVKANDIGDGMPFMFGSRNANAITKAYENGKGVRISLTQAELKANQNMGGAGIGKRIKKGVNKAKKAGKRAREGAKQGFEKVKKGSVKVQAGLKDAKRVTRQLANTMDKVDQIVDYASPLAYVPGPVGDTYQAIALASEAGKQGTRRLADGTKKAYQVSRDVNEVLHADKNDLAGVVGNKVQKYVGEYQSSEDDVYGSGNPYLRNRRVRRKAEPVFRGSSFKGGSFKYGGSYSSGRTHPFKGGSFKGGSNSAVIGAVRDVNPSVAVSKVIPARSHNPLPQNPRVHNEGVCSKCGR